MTDKGTTDDIAQRYIAVVDERDDLRSEVITLEWQLSEATNEVERLRATLQEINDLHVDEAGRCFDIAWVALGKPDA